METIKHIIFTSKIFITMALLIFVLLQGCAGTKDTIIIKPNLSPEAEMISKLYPDCSEKVIKSYLSVIEDKLRGTFAINVKDVSGMCNYPVMVNLNILPNGDVGDINIDNKVGISICDNIAVRSVMESAPFNPFPDCIDNSFRMAVRFHFVDDRVK